MKKLLQVLFIAFSSVLTLCGCQNTVNTLSGEISKTELYKVEKTKSGETKHVKTDSFLKRRLKISNVQTSISDGDLPTVAIDVRNDRTGVFNEFWSWWTNENPYPIAYKFTWYNKNGQEIESPNSGNWVKMLIYPGEIRQINSIAPTLDSIRYNLSVKETE